jgi:hypothetical protein
VKCRRGRATVIEGRIPPLESQTLPVKTPLPQMERAIQKGNTMSDTTFAPTAIPTPIPLGEILPWAIFAGLLLMLAIYFIGAEEGATALFSGSNVHEFVHDGRHLLGFPCH